MTRPLRLLIALPCLNEAETVATVIASLPKSLPGVGSVSVLVVDDGSTDDTRARALAAGAQVISHGYNRGVGAAFQTMLRYAVEQGVDLMANIDADGQFDAAEIALLVAPIVAGEADFVTGSRFVDRALIPHNMPGVKRWGNERMSTLISTLTQKKFHDVSCGFRAYSREALLQLNLHGRFTYTQETFLDLTSKGLRVKEVPVHVSYHEGRKSRVASSIPKYAMRTASIILRLYRDYNPLKFFFALAAGFLLAGLAFIAFLGWHYVSTGLFTGQIWAGFVGGALSFVGLMFGILGIVADMLDRVRVNQERILYELKRRSPRDQHEQA
ncbi:MAG: glycosyltransferase family 2 protein [Deltaproteobacteria bacterium]|nr:glycosyltransferase family 2 protein [Deltaproteobacteria bacterium]